MFRIALSIASILLLIGIVGLGIVLFIVTFVMLLPNAIPELSEAIYTEEMNKPFIIVLSYLTIILTAFGLWRFYIVLKEFLKHQFFTNRVVKNLLYASYTSIFIWFLSFFEFAETISRRSKFTLEFDLDSNPTLLIGLVLFIFAKVFEKAKQLSEENQLTI